MKKILVPCDFSAPAQEAYKFAVDLAIENKGEVHVLNVIDLPITYESTFGVQPYLFEPTLLKGMENNLRKSFEHMRESHQKCHVTFTVLQGPVYKTVCSFIEPKHIDLVVMGTRGTSNAAETTIGSTTEKIVRHSEVPVLSLRKAPALSSLKTIVYPTSLEPNQGKFVQKLKKLQKFFDATLQILYVNTPENFKRDNQIMGAGKAFTKVHNLKNSSFHMRCDYYREHGIISFAYEMKADMISMATHGRRGLSHFLRGSVAEEVVNHHLACPIWTYSLRNDK